MRRVRKGKGVRVGVGPAVGVGVGRLRDQLVYMVIRR